MSRAPIDELFCSNPKPLPKPRPWAARIIGLAALHASDIEPPADSRMEIGDHVGAVLHELAPQLYYALADEVASTCPEA